MATTTGTDRRSQMCTSYYGQHGLGSGEGVAGSFGTHTTWLPADDSCLLPHCIGFYVVGPVYQKFRYCFVHG